LILAMNKKLNMIANTTDVIRKPDDHILQQRGCRRKRICSFHHASPVVSTTIPKDICVDVEVYSQHMKNSLLDRSKRNMNCQQSKYISLFSLLVLLSVVHTVQCSSSQTNVFQLSTSIRSGLHSALSLHSPCLFGLTTKRKTHRSESCLRFQTESSRFVNGKASEKHSQVIQQATSQRNDNEFGCEATEVDDEMSVVQSAFNRITNDDDYWRLKSEQSALLRTMKTITHPSTKAEKQTNIYEDEIQHLESMVGSVQYNCIPVSATASISNASRRKQGASSYRSTVIQQGVEFDEKINDIETVELTSSTPLVQTPKVLNTLKIIHPELRAGAAAALVAAASRPLVFWENMVCGAISRSVAQTLMHPANTMKTILQNSKTGSGVTIGKLIRPESIFTLTRGAGANFLLSVPHGAVNFAVLEFVRRNLGHLVEKNEFMAKNQKKFSAGLDFVSSALATITCSVVSTPQMMIMDNIMVGNYPNLVSAVRGLAKNRGIEGFYLGWWPGLAGKIPSYALTWTIFQQLKLFRDAISDKPVRNIENSIMGCIASAATVTIMIPMDTIKTRLVTQAGIAGGGQAYKGIIDCGVRVFKEEGMSAFYRGLPPRLISVVPMIGIQFGVYEFMKRQMLQRKVEVKRIELLKQASAGKDYGTNVVLEHALMEVAASPDNPYPAPQFTTPLIK
jgi:Mitochondrial carrier protein